MTRELPKICISTYNVAFKNNTGARFPEKKIMESEFSDMMHIYTLFPNFLQRFRKLFAKV